MDSSSESILFTVLAAAFAVAIVLMILQGWLMKLSVHICGGDSIGIFYGASVITVGMIAGGIASAAVISVDRSAFSVFGLLAGVAGTLFAYCLMLQIGPLRAFAVYLVHNLLSAVSVGIIILIGIVGVYSFVPRESIEKFIAQAEEKLQQSEGLSASALNGGDEVDTSKLEGLAALLSSGASNSATTTDVSNTLTRPLGQSGPEKTNDLKEQLRDALFGGANAQPAKGSKPSPTSTKEKTGSKPVQSPYDNQIRSNPFVK